MAKIRAAEKARRGGCVGGEAHQFRQVAQDHTVPNGKKKRSKSYASGSNRPIWTTLVGMDIGVLMFCVRCKDREFFVKWSVFNTVD